MQNENPFSVIPSAVEGSRKETLKISRRDPSTALGMTENHAPTLNTCRPL